jgi:hypothetical protein
MNIQLLGSRDQESQLLSMIHFINISAKLLNYQLVTVTQMETLEADVRCRGGMLCHEMGLGKTGTYVNLTDSDMFECMCQRSNIS